MKPSNKASRNVWASLTIIGIAAVVANIPSAMHSTDVKSWCFLVLSIAIAVSFLKKFLYYQKLINQGIEYGPE